MPVLRLSFLLLLMLLVNACSILPRRPAAAVDPPSPTAPALPVIPLPTTLPAALAPALRPALDEQRNAPYYEIEAHLDPQQRSIAGTQTVHLLNTEDVALNEVYFRLYANAPHYNEGRIEVAMVAVNGQPATTALEVDDTALKVELPQPLPPGQVLELRLRFATTPPTSGGGFGIFNLADGVYTLYNWFPELAVYEQGGWLLNPATPHGDPTNTDIANYNISFSLPQSYTLISSGVEDAPTVADGQATYRINGALIRNFVLVASERFAALTQRFGDTTVNSYYLPGHQNAAQQVLTMTGKALDLFSQRFGPYMYPELDVAEVSLGGGAAGMEASGLIMVGSTFYQSGQASSLSGGAGPGLTFLDFVTIHEVAHQWWYSAVGSDAYRQPWLDESLTNWTSVYAAGEIFGGDVERKSRDAFLARPYLAQLEKGDLRLDQAVERFTLGEYGAVVYGKGALMYEALRQQIGEETFFAFLRRYYDEHKFARVDGAGWRATLAEFIGADAAAAFYQKWVEGATITAVDVPQ